MRPKLIVVTGATASGKSRFLYDYLGQQPIVVINADSRQVYRDLPISSASPSFDEQARIEHRLYNFLPISESYSAGQFMRAAPEQIALAVKQDKVPVICGGTYFYLQALFAGLLPETRISDTVAEKVSSKTSAQAYDELKQLDAVAAANIHPNNANRVKRALMLCLERGAAISTLAREGAILNNYDILMLVFDSPRPLLRERAAARIESMFASGLIREIQDVALLWKTDHPKTAWRSFPALTGIGVREFFEFAELTGSEPGQIGASDLPGLKERILLNTMQLVKRQGTWYRNAKPQPQNTKTVDPSYDNDRIAALVDNFLSRTP